MKTLLSLFILITTSTLALDTGPFVGSCEVSKVYSSFAGTYIALENCDGNLDFKSRIYQLLFKNETILASKYPEKTVIHRDEPHVILAMKQTAELAHLFQRKLRIQLDTPNGILQYFSLGESLPVACPPTPEPPKNPTPEQPTSPTDFRPVPPPPKSNLKLFEFW